MDKLTMLIALAKSLTTVYGQPVHEAVELDRNPRGQVNR